jgi:hypothetical protein
MKHVRNELAKPVSGHPKLARRSRNLVYHPDLPED